MDRTRPERGDLDATIEIAITTLSYPERQLIVVVSDSAIEAMQQASSDGEKGKRSLDVASTAAFAVNPAAAIAAELWKLRGSADKATKLPCLLVSTSQAAELRFSTGTL